MQHVSPEDLSFIATRTIAVVVPAFNEEKNITRVIDTMPKFVSHIVVVDDRSTDQTASRVERLALNDLRVVLIRHSENEGVGGSIASGYEWASERDVDVAVVMAGDGQMDPVDLPNLVLPVLRDEIHYAKGNRLLYPGSMKLIPRARFWGNSVLSLLTKIASGYWNVSDSQCGYTAIHRDALKAISWKKMYRRYGQPNDLLVTLNINNFKVKDVPVRPVYNVGEVSGMRIPKVMLPISALLFRRFIERLFLKYVVFDFHPLIFFYFIGFALLFLSVGFSVEIIIKWMSEGVAPPLTSISLMFSATTSLQCFFFAMWMDMEANKSLRS